MRAGVREHRVKAGSHVRKEALTLDIGGVELLRFYIAQRRSRCFLCAVLQCYPDNTWQAFLNGWTPRMPGIACPEADGVLGSQMGFGLIWCSEEALRLRLGSAIGRRFPSRRPCSSI